MPDKSDEDSSDSDRNEQETTQEQPRSLKQSVRISMPPTKYHWEDNHASFTLITKTRDLSSYREAIEADDHDK